MRVAFAVSEVGTNAAAGDFFTAVELGAALSANFGWDVAYLPKGDAWYELTGFDILVVMLDDYDLGKIRCQKPGLVKVGWARNWFERWCQNPSVANYNVLLASSQSAARFMSEQVGKLVKMMHIATNNERFDIGLRSNVDALDFVFTGNYWQSERDVVDALVQLPSALRGAVYGKNWEQLPALKRLHKGFMPYEQLPAVYAQASIVIDDANHVTKEWGAANSRVFDALAAGCLVITNSASVSEEVFGGMLPVYRDPAQLTELIKYYLSQESVRIELQRKLRDIVIGKHQYKHRSMEFRVWLQQSK